MRLILSICAKSTSFNPQNLTEIALSQLIVRKKKSWESRHRPQIWQNELGTISYQLRNRLIYTNLGDSVPLIPHTKVCPSFSTRKKEKPPMRECGSIARAITTSLSPRSWNNNPTQPLTLVSRPLPRRSTVNNCSVNMLTFRRPKEIPLKEMEEGPHD
jgi:hypothetical protein